MTCRHVCNRWVLSAVFESNNEVYFVPIRDSGYIKKLISFLINNKALNATTKPVSMMISLFDFILTL